LNKHFIFVKKAMVYNGLKITVLTLVSLLFSQFSIAQSNYYKFSAGLGVGPNFSYTDVYQGSWGHTFYGTFDYHFTPFVTLGLEAQYGLVQGGDIKTDRYNRQFVNEYSAISANFKLMLGEIVNYDRNEFLYSMRGFYAGFGVGVINNNIKQIVRYRPSDSNDPGYGPFPGKDNSLNIWVPINLGINFYIKDSYDYARYVININAQTNITLGEGLDGYNDSPFKFQNDSPDIYNTYSVGIKYFFGNIKVYRKTL